VKCLQGECRKVRTLTGIRSESVLQPALPVRTQSKHWSRSANKAPALSPRERLQSFNKLMVPQASCPKLTVVASQLLTSSLPTHWFGLNRSSFSRQMTSRLRRTTPTMAFSTTSSMLLTARTVLTVLSTRLEIHQSVCIILVLLLCMTNSI